MNDLLNLEPQFQTWAKITERRLKTEIIRNKAIDTGVLLANVSVGVSRRGSDMLVQARFPMHGRFVDMGVGRGRDLSKRAQVQKARRPWYGRTWYSRAYTLYSLASFKMIEESLKILKNEDFTK